MNLSLKEAQELSPCLRCYVRKVVLNQKGVGRQLVQQDVDVVVTQQPGRHVLSTRDINIDLIDVTDRLSRARLNAPSQWPYPGVHEQPVAHRPRW